MDLPGPVRLSLFAEFIANDRPLLVWYDGELYLPVLSNYPETTFGGEFETEADYRDPYVQELIDGQGLDGLAADSLLATTPSSVNLPVPAPAPPSAANWLGTDDQGRDVLARLIYGFRISVLFGARADHPVARSSASPPARCRAISAGWTDLLFQRFIEIWSGLPMLYLLIILASVVEPELLVAAGPDAAVLAGWRWSAWCARSSCARATSTTCAPPGRSASRNRSIMFRHVLPNAMVATLTFMPFILTGSITHADRARLPRLRPAAGLALARRAAEPGQGQPAGALAGLTALLGASSLMLSLLIFIGEAVRDAFDPRKTFR